MGLVKGFTDIIAPQNLATNGDFRINQRNMFTSVTTLSVGDYISDAWFLQSSSVDFLQGRNAVSGHLSFSGYGKKGQAFSIRNKDSSFLSGDMSTISDGGFINLTAAVIIENRGNNVYVNAYPRHRGGFNTDNYVSPRIVKKERKQITSSINTRYDINGGET